MNDDRRSYFEFQLECQHSVFGETCDFGETCARGYHRTEVAGQLLGQFFDDNRINPFREEDLQRVFAFMREHDIPAHAPKTFALLLKLGEAEVRIID